MVERSVLLRAILEGRRRELVGDLAEKKRSIRQAQVDGDEEARELALALAQAKAEMLAAVNQALERLGAGTYGQCDECGGDISANRLKAQPAAVRCTDCEEARELAARRERQRLTLPTRPMSMF